MELEKNKYCCKSCNYTTSKQSTWITHMNSVRHQKRTANESLLYSCDKCNKSYKIYNSYWHHKKTCLTEQEQLHKELEKYKEETRISHEKVLEICLTLAKSNAAITVNQNNNTICNNNSNNVNQNFNLNVFLNEHCKDAMNIIDFVKNIHLEMKDFLYANQVGYVDAISHIFDKEISKIELNKRPMHCTDIKRDTLYVKNEDKWVNDADKTITEKAIELISNRNLKLMKQWKEENPDYMTCPNKNYEYLMLMRNSLGGSTDQEQDSNSKKIMKNVIKCVQLKKDKIISASVE